MINDYSQDGWITSSTRVSIDCTKWNNEYSPSNERPAYQNMKVPRSRLAVRPLSC